MLISLDLINIQVKELAYCGINVQYIPLSIPRKHEVILIPFLDKDRKTNKAPCTQGCVNLLQQRHHISLDGYNRGSCLVMSVVIYCDSSRSVCRIKWRYDQNIIPAPFIFLKMTIIYYIISREKDDFFFILFLNLLPWLGLGEEIIVFHFSFAIMIALTQIVQGPCSNYHYV